MFWAVADLDVHVTAVGDGPERERLDALSKESGAKVIFEGMVDSGNIFNRQESAGSFILRSIKYEEMPFI